MRVRLKPISEQVIVITGASSGIGLVTARMAARQGARVVLGARDGAALERVVEEIRGRGGEAASAEVDVADAGQVKALADLAEREFGHIDTWVNNAGVSVYGWLTETPEEDHRRLFETNYWGVVHGSQVAAERLSRRGGALITVGSSVGDRAVPLQGAYSATKHAVKGFTNALRMELEAHDLPISVTLIKPGAIDTMYEEHARNLLGREPRNPPPVYAPETVARAILHAAQHPVRDLVVGSGGRLLGLSEALAPRLTDRLMERYLVSWEVGGGPRRRHDDSLYHPYRDGRERAGRHALVREHSYYTGAAMHPVATLAVLAGAVAIATAALGGRQAVRNAATPRLFARRRRAPGPAEERAAHRRMAEVE
jgi:short-subunit dehydrogenase